MHYLRLLTTTAILSLSTADAALAEPAGLSRHKNFDATITWQAKVSGKKAMIDGTITNTRFAAMEDLEMAVSVLGRNGMKIGADRQILIPRSLRLDDAAQFTLAVPLAEGSQPETLHFTYRYRANEGDAERPMQIQTFEAPFTASSAGAASP